MRLQRLDIQTKIILVLVAVIVPTFLVTTILQNKLALPILEGEMRALGLSTAESIAAKILASKWHLRQDGPGLIENEIQEQLYSQPNITRLDVFLKDTSTGVLKHVAAGRDIVATDKATAVFLVLLWMVIMYCGRFIAYAPV